MQRFNARARAALPMIPDYWQHASAALAQHDPDDWLLQGDPAVLALIAENDQVFKHHLNRYKYAERYPEQPMEHYRAEGEVFLRKLEDLLADREYLLADHLSLADAALAPFVRQFAHVDRDWFEQAPYPRLNAWLERFLDALRPEDKLAVLKQMEGKATKRELDCMFMAMDLKPEPEMPVEEQIQALDRKSVV